MAARCVYKLISKTYSITSNSAYSSTIPTISTDKCYRKPQRSFSQPPQKSYEPRKETFIQLRSISKSLENLREMSYRDEEYETDSRHNAFPAADLTVREPAKEFKEKYVQEEYTEEGNPIYELAEANRSQENFYDVLNYMRRAEAMKMKNLFMHLQPSNIKPYGSSENLVVPTNRKKKIKIVYPVTKVASQTEVKKTRSGKVQYKEYSTKVPHKQYPVFEETKKMAICESGGSIERKNYSTSFIKRRPSIPKFPLKASMNSIRRCSNKLKKKMKEDLPIEEPVRVGANPELCNQKFNKAVRVSSKELLLQCANIRRSYNTQNKPVEECTAVVTVKLNDLKEECRKAKKCKPKKICFGRLPKLTPPDCPCLVEFPMNEGKPLARLKKRFDVKEPKMHCVEKHACTTPRADANYKIVPKVLPKIQVEDCPCEEREMTDFIIKRLPKRKIPEPKRVCDTCELTGDCCPPRADGKIEVKRKSLPTLAINHCPCIEEQQLKDVPLKKLKKVVVAEPVRKCPKKDICDLTLRADYGLTVEKKILPEIKGECPCPVMPVIADAEPLPRLKKIEIEEKPRKSCKDDVCDLTLRADKDLKIPKKQLPKFKAQDCPCIEETPPDKMVKLKRLQPKPVKEKPKICGPKEVCGPRADDNLVITRKQLRQIEVGDCPCVLTEMKDIPPLKRLKPKPIEEKPRVCKKKDVCAPRSDESLKVEKKSLPVLPPGNCPCIEPPPPLDIKPLPKLKKKPVTNERKCPKVEVCNVERADEHYKIQMKQLPKLQINNCPCFEEEPLEDVPLTRLKKVKIPEPPRVCKAKDDCADIPRADKDDWMYWRHVAVKCEPESSKTIKKNYSTFATNRRYYSTTLSREKNDIFNLKYDFSTIFANKLTNEVNNIIIDIKPSAPLILSQKRLDSSQKENLRLSKSERDLAFVICKSNNLASTKPLKESVNTKNRYISTCSTLCEYSERSKDNSKMTPCECPPSDLHLQPKYPIIPEKETFITPYPDDDWVYETSRRARKYSRTRKEEAEKIHVTNLSEECAPKEGSCSQEIESVDECVEEVAEPPPHEEKQLTIWEKILNYFKARPNCPSPEEFKKIRLREDAERAAQKAGLCLYDPKEMLKKSEKELPKVITADPCKKEECEK